MSFLLDTNVVSEWVKPQPNPGVIAWLAGADEDRVLISVVTLTELRYGIERLPSGKRRERLDAWLRSELPLRFEMRVLPIDHTVAEACGTLMARSEAAGRSMSAPDGFIAATAQVYKLAIVTRNVSDFASAAVSVVNPWV